MCHNLRRIGLLIAICAMGGCSAKRLAGGLAKGFVNDAIVALEREEDLEIARYSLAADIKILDALCVSRPRDRELLSRTIQARCAFALGFVEEEDPARAARLYRKAMEDGFVRLDENAPFQRARESRNAEALAESLKGFKRRELPLLFWSVSAWAAWVNLSRDDPAATSQADLVREAIEHVLKEDEAFHWGSPQLMAGLFYASRPKLLGGDPDKGKAHFERCIEISEGHMLLAKVLLAEYYAV